MPPSLQDNLKLVFGIIGAPQIGELVEKFDFSKIDVNDTSRQDYLHTTLAPSYGTLTKEGLKEMDDELKIMIAATMEDLAKIPAEKRDWEAVMSAMMSCALIEPDGDAVNRADKVIKDNFHVFKFDGGPNAAIVKEVEAMFVGLINDVDVLAATNIKIKELAEIVAQTGATVTSLETAVAKTEYHEKTLVDIGVLRFPDIEHPHFQVFRIQLIAWSQSKRILAVQKDTNGITGTYFSRKFKPRANIIAELSSKTRAKMVKSVEEEWE